MPLSGLQSTGRLLPLPANIILCLNEAGTFKSTSMLIYSHLEQSICTQDGLQDAVVLKS
jgi:hypothetical protein